jgi:hypothetical protein
MRRFRGSSAAAALLTACLAWPRGPRIAPEASGLVGVWVSATTPGAGDTTWWQFTADGRAMQVTHRGGHPAREIQLGPFRVYADTGRTQLICFSFRRGRARPGCRYLQVDTLQDPSGGTYREVRWLHWVGEGRREPEVWTEHAP